MAGILPIIFIIILFLGLVGVGIYEAVVAAQLSLPTAPLTIPALVLPILALANAIFAQRVTSRAQRRQLKLPGATTNSDNNAASESTTGSRRPPFLTVAALQVLQAIYTTVVATLLAAAAPPGSSGSVGGCLLEKSWQHLYSSHDEAAIRSIQDRLACCGFNSPGDRAWPFPRGRPDDRDKLPTCEKMSGRHTACHTPWEAAMRRNASADLAVALAVGLFQLVSVLVLTRFSDFLRGNSWLGSMFGYQNDRHPPQHPQRRNLIGNGEPYSDRADEEEEGGNNEPAPDAAAGAGHRNGPRLEPSLLGGHAGGGGGAGSNARNEWADD